MAKVSVRTLEDRRFAEAQAARGLVRMNYWMDPKHREALKKMAADEGLTLGEAVEKVVRKVCKF
ncbi:MAG: hypothetical protein ING69_10590 [Rhodocyclaceae bacterium]|nr:hypothetical protein [Rhodocyclaceae bacterium]